MSRSAIAAAVLAFVFVATTSTAAAQMRSRARFGAAVGATVPTGDFHADSSGEGFNTGWQGLVFIEFREPRRPLGLRVELTVGENPGNDKLIADGVALVGGPVSAKLRMVGANVDVTYHLRRSAHGGGAYLLGGIGSERVTFATTAGGISADSSETKFAWNAGAGMTFPFAGAGLFVELRYFDVAKVFRLTRLPFFALTGGFRFGRK